MTTRSDKRAGSLIREMACVIPCVYRLGTAGLPSSTAGELNLEEKRKLVFRHGQGSAGISEGAMEIPYDRITTLELSGDHTLLMIRASERPGKHLNAGFTRSTERAKRKWSPYTLQVLEARTGKRIGPLARRTRYV
jgi:hypothetical protein